MYTLLMRAVIRTWGNSLAVRIPKAFAVHMGIDAGKEVELFPERDGLRIEFVGQDLNLLLEQITPENLHAEAQTGSAIGQELW